MAHIMKTHRIPPLLLAAIALALMLRLLAAFSQGNSVEPLPGVHDQLTYQMLAERIVDGKGFSFPKNWWPATKADEPTAHWSFLYSLYLAGVYAVAGVYPLVPRLIQALIAGVLHPWLIWRIGNRLFGEQVGLVAAILTALYSYFILYSSSLMTEIFYILAILWALDILTGLAVQSDGRKETPLLSWKPWLLLGVALGVGILLRQVLLITVPLLIAWIWWTLCFKQKLAPSRALLLRMVLIAGVISIFILPWTVRNYSAFGRFVLLNTNAGFAFYWSNHPIHETSFVSILRADQPSYRELIPAELQDLDEVALDRALMAEGIRIVLEDPARYLLLSLNRTKDLFKFWPSSNSTINSNLARVFSFGLCLPFILYGLFLILTGRHKNHSTRGVGLLLLFVSTYSAVHLLSWSLIRYRLPIDAVLILFASVGICRLLQALESRSGGLTEALHRPSIQSTFHSTAAPQRRGNATE